MIFVDTNIVIDILRRDPQWFAWSIDRLVLAAGDDSAAISAVVVAELSRDFGGLADLMAKLDRLSIVAKPLSTLAAFAGGRAFQAFRRTRRDGDHPRVLPDFLIGAHALVEDAALLTRDARLYRRYFPDLSLITPETHP